MKTRRGSVLRCALLESVAGSLWAEDQLSLNETSSRIHAPFTLPHQPDGMRPPFTFIRVALLAVLSLAIHSSALAGNGQWTLIGWNNLGMHCMDDDYSVFTILPPYNTVNSQLINAQGKLVLAPTGLTLTYEPVADLCFDAHPTYVSVRRDGTIIGHAANRGLSMRCSASG